MENKKQEIKRYIEKENGKLVFVTDVPNVVVRKEYITKENFKKTYDEVKVSQKNSRDNLASINKRLEGINTAENEELKKFIELANLAQGYHNGEKLKEEKAKAENDLKLIDQQLNDMEKALPELIRNKSQKK